MRYWHFGNSYNFLLLLDHMGEAERCREVVQQNIADEDEIDEAQSFLQPSKDYFRSFTRDVKDLWGNITAPFRRATQDEIDFVADGSDEEGDDEMGNHLAFHAQSEIAEFQRRQSVDDQLAARYEHMEKQLRRERRDSDSSETGPDPSFYKEKADHTEDTSDDDDDSFQRDIQRKRKVSPRKKPAPRSSKNRRKTQATLESFMVTKKEEVITLDDDTSSEGEARQTSRTRRTKKNLKTAEGSSDDEDNSPIVHSASRHKKRLVIDDDDDD